MPFKNESVFDTFGICPLSEYIPVECDHLGLFSCMNMFGIWKKKTTKKHLYLYGYLLAVLFHITLRFISGIKLRRHLRWFFPNWLAKWLQMLLLHILAQVTDYSCHHIFWQKRNSKSATCSCCEKRTLAAFPLLLKEINPPLFHEIWLLLQLLNLQK